MIIENITSKGISLDRNGQSMQREVYEREIVKLQSNWNSLREWLEVNDRYSQGYFKQVLEYMNELEGKDKE